MQLPLVDEGSPHQPIGDLEVRRRLLERIVVGAVLVGEGVEISPRAEKLRGECALELLQRRPSFGHRQDVLVGRQVRRRAEEPRQGEPLRNRTRGGYEQRGSSVGVSIAVGATELGGPAPGGPRRRELCVEELPEHRVRERSRMQSSLFGLGVLGAVGGAVLFVVGMGF